MNEKEAKTVAKALPGNAKRFLIRTKRGWLSERTEETKASLYKNEEGPEESRRRENTREASERTCRATCLGAWGAWGQCTEKCGAHGTQNRVRSPVKSCGSTCPGVRTETQICNRFCPNGGTPTIGGQYKPCACSHGYQGECCEEKIDKEFGDWSECSVTCGGGKYTKAKLFDG